MRTDRLQLIALAGAGVALGAILLNLGFFFRPGTGEVLSGLAHHASILVLLLVLTAGSRTVSFGTLGIFWLLGVWSVYAVAYLLESQLSGLFGFDVDGEFVPIWLAPFIEETTKLLPVAAFLLLAARLGRHPSMSDGLLLGFMVGAGVSFQEDAQFGEILVSGEGWNAATPWTAIFPTISPLDSYFALNHALWAAFSGLTIGAAVMLRHWRWAWPIALVGPLLSFANHVMSNHITSTEFGTRALLNRAAGRDVPWFYDMIRNVTDGGRVQMLALIAAAFAVVVVEWFILRWVSKRDRLFPTLSIARVFRLLKNCTSKQGFAQLWAAESYVTLRRSLYFSAWRTRLAGGYPDVRRADFARLVSLADRLDVLPAATMPGSLAMPASPEAQEPADAPVAPGT